MPMERWSQPLYRAYIDADPNEFWGEQLAREFEARWGSLDTDERLFPTEEQLRTEHSRLLDVFQRVLETQIKDSLWGIRCRLFTLLALGRLRLPGGEELLRLFVQSPDDQERWAAILSLARYRDAQALPLLLPLLLEGLEPLPVFLPLSSDPEELERAIRLQQDYLPDQRAFLLYEWFMLRRHDLTELLGAWGRREAIPPLSQALQTCWCLLRQTEAARGWHWWQHYADHLAYALGRLDAWSLPPEPSVDALHLFLAQMYQVFGSLPGTQEQHYQRLHSGLPADLWAPKGTAVLQEICEPPAGDPETKVLASCRPGLDPKKLAAWREWEKKRYEEQARRPKPGNEEVLRYLSLLVERRRREKALAFGLDAQAVSQALATRFGFSAAEQRDALAQFHLACLMRSHQEQGYLPAPPEEDEEPF